MKLKGFSSTIILFILLTQSMCYSQNNCDCAEFEKAEKKSNNEELMNSLVKSSNAFCVAKSHEMLAEFFVDEGEFDSAAFYLKKAETIYKSNGCGLGAFQNNYKYWAGLNYNKGDFSKSLDFSLKYLKCAEENKNTYEICNAYTMIAQLFNQIEQTNNGIPYLQKAIPLIENMEMSNKKADLFLKLARRFMWNYQDTKNTNRLDSSKLFAQKTLDIARILKRDRAMAGAFNVLQGCEYEKGNYKQALILLDSSAKYTDMSNDADRALYLQDKADILMELGDYTSALSLTDTVISIYKKSDNASFTATAYDLKYSILKRSGNMAEALKYLEMTRKLEDSLVNIESKEKINELEQKYKKTQNEQTIKELYQASEISSLRNRILLVLVLVALLIIIIIVFINRQRRLKNKQEAMEIEQRLNRARMNPHFFFNTLTSLQSFSELENEDSKVSRYLSKYAKIMRQTLESTYNEMNNLDE